VVDHHRHDVLLDEREQVAVAVAADLVEHAPVVVVEAADRFDTGDPFRQEPLGEIEVAAGEAVVDGPGLGLRRLEARGIAVLVSQQGSPSL
jgi:hypothetical protein